MTHRLIRRLAAAATLILVGQSTIAPSPSHAAETCTVAAAGDIAGKDDWRTGAARTAELIERSRPRAVLALGDLAYNYGTRAEFSQYYDPTWGRFKDITRPTPGNHEYYTAAEGSAGHDATAYFEYFKVPPQYSFDLCGWHLVSLNSETDPSAQVDFLAKDVARHRGKPLLVFWHQPRFSSGSHGSNPQHQPLWAAATRAGASIVLVAHDHMYERFGRMDASGNSDRDGVRQFVSGAGGHHPRKTGSYRAPNSEKLVEGRGVLFLDLRSDGYTWHFVSPDGRTHDRGTDGL